MLAAEQLRKRMLNISASNSIQSKAEEEKSEAI
jgi:hypothetical protein